MGVLGFPGTDDATDSGPVGWTDHDIDIGLGPGRRQQVSSREPWGSLQRVYPVPLTREVERHGIDTRQQ